MLHQIRHKLHLEPGSAITVSTDSRNCQKGCVFFALKGDNFDGNQYAAAALANGAALAVVDDPSAAIDDSSYLLVDDTLKALQQTAAQYRDEFDIPVVGITGTNGKTTTKELIAACLAQKFRIHYTQGNLNNHIGVPLTLLAMPCDTQIAIIEMGASHPGDINELVDIAHPTCGLITNVGKAHLQGFGSFDGVIKTKCELYDYLRAHDGFIFVNSANDILLKESEKRGLKRLEYAIGNEAHTHAEITGHDNSCMLALSINNTKIQTNLIGQYNAENVLAAIAVATHFGVSIGQCKAAIENYHPTNNRSQLLKTANNTLIVDAYNANPTSMEAALRNFKAIKPDKPMLIIGQMGELGEYQKEAHQHIINIIRQLGFNDVMLVGDNFRETDSGFTIFSTTAQLMQCLKDQPVHGKTILIKGSHSNRLDTITTLL